MVSPTCSRDSAVLVGRRLRSEDAEAFDAFRSRLVSTLAPVGDLEALLVDRIVGLAWRLGRVTRIETGLLTEDPEDYRALARETKDGPLRLASQFRGERDELTTLAHLEAGLERGLFKALHALERLQTGRAGGQMLPPVALDVTGDGTTVSG